MLLSLRKNGLDCLFKEVRVFKAQHKEFFICLGFLLHSKGKEAPNIKSSRRQGSLGGGGSRRGVSGEIVYVYAFFRGLSNEIAVLQVGRAPKYRTKRCSRYWRPKFTAMKWLECCKNQCSRSRAVSERAWTPFCVILKKFGAGWQVFSESQWSFWVAIAIAKGTADYPDLRPRPPLTGVSKALRAQNPPKVSERVDPGAVRPRGRKSVRTSLKTVAGVPKETVLRLQRLFWDCFGPFFRPRGRLFRRLLGGLRARRAWDWETPGQLQGLKTPNPEIPRKKLKNPPPPWAPTPNSLKILKNTKIHKK